MDDTIKTAIENASQYLGSHPDEARYTDSPATAILEAGLRCRVTGGKDPVYTDMPTSVGGGDSAASAGWLWRASIAACVTTLVAMRAAAQEVPLATLEVEVDSESDDRGILGLDPLVPAGPLSTRIAVRIGSPGGSEAELRALVEWALEHCPVTEALGRVVPVSHEIVIG